MHYPLLADPVPAGPPSPVGDWVECALSLDEHLVEHQESTVLMRVTGHSMTGFGIHDGDLLVVDRAQAAADRSLVVALVDGAATLKQFCRLPEGVLLRAGAPGHGDILVQPGQAFSLWGVVRWAIHPL